MLQIRFFFKIKYRSRGNKNVYWLIIKILHIPILIAVGLELTKVNWVQFYTIFIFS